MDAFSRRHRGGQRRQVQARGLPRPCWPSLATTRRTAAASTLYQPTDDDRDSFVKSELEPCCATAQRRRRCERQGGGKGRHQKLKGVPGSLAHFLGGKATRPTAASRARSCCLDELDGFDQTVEKSADPSPWPEAAWRAPFPRWLPAPARQRPQPSAAGRARRRPHASQHHCPIARRAPHRVGVAQRSPRHEMGDRPRAG